MTAQMKSQVHDHVDSISIILCFANFKKAFITDVSFEGAAIWVNNFFINGSAFTAHNAKLASNHIVQMKVLPVHKANKWSTYQEVFNYLLHSFVTDENVETREKR